MSPSLSPALGRIRERLKALDFLPSLISSCPKRQSLPDVVVAGRAMG